MIPSIKAENLQTQRDDLYNEVSSNEDWALLNNMGALPAKLEFDLVHEKIDEGLTIEKEADTVHVFLKHKTTRKDNDEIVQDNGTTMGFVLGDLPEDINDWTPAQKESLFAQGWEATGYDNQMKLLAEVLVLIGIKNAL